MARKAATAEPLRGRCRHCGGALIFWQCDEKTERWGEMVYRSEKPRFWHLNPDEEHAVADSIYTDSKWEKLGAYCPVKVERFLTLEEQQNIRGQVGEPEEWCVVLKGEWPQQFCLNPVQDTDFHMCGVHAKKERERARQLEARREQAEASQAHQYGGDEVCKRLLENWGLHATVRAYRFDGKVEIQHEELETLLQSLEEEYKLLMKRRQRAKQS